MLLECVQTYSGHQLIDCYTGRMSYKNPMVITIQKHVKYTTHTHTQQNRIQTQRERKSQSTREEQERMKG